MGIRLSGGIGPLRVSVPVGGAATGFFGLAVKVTVGMFWWMLVGCYWLLRAVYWELPRAGYRWWRRHQAAAPR